MGLPSPPFKLFMDRLLFIGDIDIDIVIVLNKIGRKFYAKFIVANFGVMFLYIVFKTC